MKSNVKFLTYKAYNYVKQGDVKNSFLMPPKSQEQGNFPPLPVLSS